MKRQAHADWKRAKIAAWKLGALHPDRTDAAYLRYVKTLARVRKLAILNKETPATAG